MKSDIQRTTYFCSHNIERHYCHLLYGSEILYSNTRDILFLRHTLLYCVKRKLFFIWWSYLIKGKTELGNKRTNTLRIKYRLIVKY